jgi:hypothetical protein
MAAHLHLPVLGTDVTADMVADPSSICEWNPDMYGIRNTEAGQKYYDSILQLYASWGVDFIKVDDICATGPHPRKYSRKHEVEMLHKAIKNCRRDIVLSLSPGPADVTESWHYSRNANMWRITDDFWDNWETLLYMFDRCEKWQDHVRPGNWPDCDMLPLGKVGKHFGQERDCLFTKEEQKTMMSLWCIFGSPLMLGAEMTLLDEWTLSLLQNKDLLDLHSHRFIGRQVLRDKEKCVWAALDPESGEHFVALFNLLDKPQDIFISPDDCSTPFPGATFIADSYREIWSGEASSKLQGTVAPHGVLLFHNK